MTTTSLILRIIGIFIAALCLILIGIDKEKHILNTKMKAAILVFNVLAFIFSIYLLVDIIIKIRNENKVYINQIIVLDEKAVNDDRSFIYFVTEEFKKGSDVVVLMPQNYNKEKLYNLAEQYDYKILTKDTMEIRYNEEVKGIENDRIIFRKR